MSIQVHVNLWQENYGSPFQDKVPEADANTSYLEENAFVAKKIENHTGCPDFVFVDGVMRKEASMTWEIDGEIVQAQLFSIAAGALLTESDKINLLSKNILELLFNKILIIDKAEMTEAVIEFWENKMGSSIVVSSTLLGDENTAVMNEMRKLEGKVVENLVNGPGLKDGTVLIADGTLHFPTYPYPIIGLIKSVQKPYPNTKDFQENRLLEYLKSRSSIFKIEDKKPRLSWYVTLTPKEDERNWIYSLVRLELYEEIGLEKAKKLADATALYLPRFVLAHIPRYPQNLAPVSVLENYLRTLLGNKALNKNSLLESLT